MRARGMVVCLLAGCVMFTAGCGRRDARSHGASDEPQVSVTHETLQAELDALKAGDQSVMLKRIKEMLSDKRYAAYKFLLVDEFLNCLASGHDVQKMQEEFLEMAIKDDDVGRMGFPRVESIMCGTNVVDVQGWYNKVLQAPVSPEMKVYTWQRMAAKNQGPILPLVKRLDEIMALPQDGDSLIVVQSLASAGLSVGDYAGLASLQAAVAKKAPGRRDLAKVMLVTEVKALLKQGGYDQACKVMDANTDRLGDAELRKLKVAVLRGALGSGKSEFARELVDKVYADGEKHPLTRTSVATFWIGKAVESRDVKQFLDRMDKALAAGCLVEQLIPVIHDGFYVVMTSGDGESSKRCAALLEGLGKKEGLSEYARQNLVLLQLDGAFYREDFRAAYDIVKAGVPGKDEKWQAEMVDKVGAHLALQEKRYEDAIKLFRNHMARIAAWKTAVVNPANGASMTKEAVLGFNEKRLGDIYREMGGHEADAKAAYDRAREWYDKAIKEAKPGSVEAKLAQEELNQVP